MSHPALSVRGNGITLRVKVHPRAKQDAITGLVGDSLKLSLTSPPADGKANAACVRFFAELFGIPRSAVQIISGFTSRNKVVALSNLSREQAEAALAVHLQ